MKLRLAFKKVIRPGKAARISSPGLIHEEVFPRAAFRFA
jgi:hypothetical protein